MKTLKTTSNILMFLIFTVIELWYVYIFIADDKLNDTLVKLTVFGFIGFCYTVFYCWFYLHINKNKI